jgi:hypothetical protein
VVEAVSPLQSRRRMQTNIVKATVFCSFILATGCVTDLEEDLGEDTHAEGSGQGSSQPPPPRQVCVVDQLKLAPGGSVIDSGGVGSVGVDVRRDPTTHEYVTVGLIDFKGPFIYHPEKLLRYNCQRTADNNGCEAKVATSAMTYDTGDQLQQGLGNTFLWRHPSINVARNSEPVVMTDTNGGQYSVVHFRTPETKREFKYEPTFLNGRNALAAAISTASRMEQHTWFDLDLSYYGFSLEIPEIGWREAQHTNSAGATVSCGFAQPCTPDVTVNVTNASDKVLVVGNCVGEVQIPPNTTKAVPARRNDSLRGAHHGSGSYGIMRDPQPGKSYSCSYTVGTPTPYQTTTCGN